MTILHEVLPELFTRSEVLPLYFADITKADEHKNIQRYINEQVKIGQNPRDAQHRQAFNEQILETTGMRYLIGRYSENRANILSPDSHMVKEGRTFHLGIDAFSAEQEPVFAPCDGEIVISAYEPGAYGYGNYIIVRPDDASLPYIFFGHLASNRHSEGRIHAGEKIAQLGSYENLENGGWSIHLHLQLLQDLPPTGETPIGYSTEADLPMNMNRFPNPLNLFPEWTVRR